MKTKLMQGDCLDRMNEIKAGVVDMILTDPPYGTTQCSWDYVIPLEPMWEQLERIIKPNGAIVMIASQPFTTILIASKIELFKYCWVWKKNRPTGHVHAKNKPLKAHEDVCIFSKGTTTHAEQSDLRMTYNPQNTKPTKQNVSNTNSLVCNRSRSAYNGTQTVTNYPNSIIEFNTDEKRVHPTQKPATLMEYFIKTYTNKGETVLDFTMGSGSTGVACANLNRNFIGIELDPNYFKIAKKRIGHARKVQESSMNLL